MKKLEGSIALVTGASRGIGFAIAQILACEGAHIVATARTQGGLEELDDRIRSEGGSATLLPLDLADGPQVDLIGPSLHNRFGRLDILVHCAGILGPLTPLSHITDKAWSQALALNSTAALRLIRTTTPLLTRAPAGRAVFLTSHLASATRAYFGTYAATKSALQQLALTWAAESETTPLRVNLFDPGPTATRFRAEAMPGEDRTALPTPLAAAEGILPLCLPAEARNGEVIEGNLEVKGRVFFL